MNGDLADDDVHDDAEHGPPTLTAPVRPGQTAAGGAVQDEQPLRTAWAGPTVRDVETWVVSNDRIRPKFTELRLPCAPRTASFSSHMTRRSILIVVIPSLVLVTSGDGMGGAD